MLTAKIKIQRIEVTCEDYRRTCADPAIRKELTKAIISEYGPSGSDPKHYHTAASKAVRSLGAELISFEEREELERGSCVLIHGLLRIDAPASAGVN